MVSEKEEREGAFLGGCKLKSQLLSFFAKKPAKRNPVYAGGLQGGE